MIKIESYKEMNSAIISDNYNRIDGYNNYMKNRKGMTFGCTDEGIEVGLFEEGTDYKDSEKNNTESEKAYIEGHLPLYQLLDMTIFAVRSLAYLREAYRYPKYYEPGNGIIDRIGLQGDAMTVKIDEDNPQLETELAKLVNNISKMDELLGQRLRVLYGILEGMEQ